MDLKPEVPAMGIMKMSSYPMYKFMCNCGCEDHDVVMEFDEDEFGKTVTFYATTSTPYWLDRFGAGVEDRPAVKKAKQLANSVYNRVSLAYQALFRGYIKTESTTILSDQQATTLAALLASAASKDNRRK